MPFRQRSETCEQKHRNGTKSSSSGQDSRSQNFGQGSGGDSSGCRGCGRAVLSLSTVFRQPSTVGFLLTVASPAFTQPCQYKGLDWKLPATKEHAQNGEWGARSVSVDFGDIPPFQTHIQRKGELGISWPIQTSHQTDMNCHHHLRRLQRPSGPQPCT